MAKTIKFNLLLDGKSIRDLDGVRENFSIEDMLDFYEKGLLQRWLKVRGYGAELEKVEQINAKIDAKSRIIELIKIFNVVKDNKEIDESIYALRFWDERKMELDLWQKKDYANKKIIADYHNGYATLKAQIATNKADMSFMKAAVREIQDKYLEIFEIDFSHFFILFKDDVPLIVFAILMNDKLRDYFLNDKEILPILREQFVPKSSAFDFIHMTCRDDNESSDDINKKIGLTTFRGKTDGYWKDLEVESKQVMVLTIPGGTYVRNKGVSGEELSRKDTNGNFIILNGVDYKSNIDSADLVYMEV